MFKKIFKSICFALLFILLVNFIALVIWISKGIAAIALIFIGLVCFVYHELDE